MANAPLVVSPHWIVAGQQTSGRGRQGRIWSSPPGNFYATLLLIDPCDPRHAAKLGFVAGVALLETAQYLCPQLSGLKLKWPNDLLLDGAKLSGILLEGTRLADGRFAVAIGMGVNLAFHPDDTPYPATSLAKAGAPVNRADFLTVLSDRFTEQLVLFQQGAGFEAIRTKWMQNASGISRQITVRTPEGSQTGIFDEIDEDGRLLLRQENRSHRIDVGDVCFSPPYGLDTTHKGLKDSKAAIVATQEPQIFSDLTG